MGRLTAALVRALSKPGRYGDGGTLFLRVAPGGSKGWVQRLTIGGKRRDLGLGGWPVVTLAEARDQAIERIGGSCAAAATRWPTGAGPRCRPSRRPAIALPAAEVPPVIVEAVQRLFAWRETHRPRLVAEGGEEQSIMSGGARKSGALSMLQTNGYIQRGI